MKLLLYSVSILCVFVSCSSQQSIDPFDVTHKPTRNDLLKWGYVLVEGVDAEVYEKQIDDININYQFDKHELGSKIWLIKLDTLVPSDSIINKKLYQLGLSRYGPVGHVYKELIKQHCITFHVLNKNRDTLSCLSVHDEEGIWLQIMYLFPIDSK